jgi:GDPmannose 4,6-dehydratase
MRAIVTGVAGQDGFYMTKLLAARGIAVLGLTSNLEHARGEFARQEVAGLTLAPFDYTRPGDFTRVVNEFEPDLVFNIAAKATGQGMFDGPHEMSRLNGTFVIDILEALRNSPRATAISFCQCSSSEMFGNVTEMPQCETTAFRPKSPYGAAKLYAHNMVGVYRATYGLRCCSAILYNHESIRRSTQFVTRKIAHGAASIKQGLAGHLTLGALEISRDWGYAPEYVEAMYLMAVAPQPADYVVATGRTNTIRRLCEIAFGHLDLDYQQYVRVDASGKRAIESVGLQGDPSKIGRELGWSATRRIEAIMHELVDYEMTVSKSAAASAATTPSATQ